MSERRRQRRSGETPVRGGLQDGSFLRRAVKDGLAAVATAHMSKIDASLRSLFSDSLDLDMALQSAHPQDHRWDYLLGHKESVRIVGLEPHSAENSEIETVIRKREAAMRHLKGHLRDGVRVEKWFWVASGKIQFLPFDKKILKLSQNGITFVGRTMRITDLGSLVQPPRTSPTPRKSASRRDRS